jgi:integrase
MSRRVEGTITARTKWADGTTSYLLTWYLGTQPNGKRQYGHKTVRVKTKGEARDELQKTVASLKDRTYVAPAKLTVGQCCEAWLESRLALRKVRANTYADYAEKLRAYVIPRIGATELQKLDTAQVQALYNELLSGGAAVRKRDGEAAGLSAQTVIHIHRRLRQVMGWARKTRQIALDPTADVDLPTVGEDRRDDGGDDPGDDRQEIGTALDAEQLNALLAGFQGHSLEAFARLAARTGMRRGELLALRWCDIDAAKRTLRVEWTLVDGGKAADRRFTFERPKTKRSRRTIALSDATVAELDALWKQRAQDALKLGITVQRNSEDLLFPHSILEPRRPRNPRNLTKEFIRKAAAIGYPIRLHDLRHTHATLLLKNGADLKTVSQRLGDANPSITLNRYQHVLPGMQEQVAKVFDSALGSIG